MTVRLLTDTEAAKAMPGVLDIIVGAELEAEGIGHLGSAFPPAMLKNRDGSPRVDGDRALDAVAHGAARVAHRHGREPDALR